MAYDTDSPRDDAVDGNPELARKRARLSESPGSSEAVPIQSIDPGEDLLEDPNDFIRMNDSMDGMEDDERYWPSPLIEQALRNFHETTSSEFYVHLSDFQDIVNWLQDHLDGTERLSSNILLELYTKDESFWYSLALAFNQVARRNDLFETQPCKDHSALGSTIGDFFIAIAKLAVRHILLLPSLTKERLARRDSQQPGGKPGPQSVGSLAYISSLDLIMSLTKRQAQFKYLTQEADLDWTRTGRECVEGVQEAVGIFAAFATILRDLSSSPREVKDSWIYIKSILRIVDNTCFADAADANAEEIVSIINEIIMPTVREKHPRALPNNFHVDLIWHGGHILWQQAGRVADDPAACFSIYERLIKSDEDAFFFDVDAQPSAKALSMVCEGDADLCAVMIRAAWVVKTVKEFICSSIMDIRSTGINHLCEELRDWYARYSDCSDHPVIAYAARFLKHNRLISYIFGVDSHAGIISGARDILDFLAAAGRYTDAETDVVWQACTTNVEADFVKASFGVLQYILENLQFNQTVHIAWKFTEVPPAAVAHPAAVNLLSAVFDRLHCFMLHTSAAVVEERAVALLDLAIKLLYHTHSAGVAGPMSELSRMAVTEIASARHYGLDAQKYVQKLLAPAILEKTPDADPSTEAFVALLSMSLSPESIESVAEILPLDAVLDELVFVVHRATSDGRSINLQHRINLLLRLLSLQPEMIRPAVVERIFNVLLGLDASNNVARDSAWIDIVNLSHSQLHRIAAQQILRDLLEDHVPNSSVDLATPALVEVLRTNIKRKIQMADAKDGGFQLLDLPLWKTLVRIAAESKDQYSANQASLAICDVLFNWPEDSPSSSMLACAHVGLVRHVVEQLCEALPPGLGASLDAQARRFRQAVDLLWMVLQKSKDLQSSRQLVVPLEKITLDGCDEDQNALYFRLQICTPQGLPMYKNVKASTTSTVGELAAALPDKTGSLTNKVVISGRQVDLEADRGKLLAEIGVIASGLIMICPVFTPESHVDAVLTVSGPVEEEMLKQYDRLEPFLDRPEPIARNAFNFLVALRPSYTARARICSEQTSAEQLFPADRPRRSAYSASVLRTNLKDYARLGVADAAFISRSIRLLASVLMDDAHAQDGHVLSTVVDCLGDFLRGTCRAKASSCVASRADTVPERPSDTSSIKYFDQPEAFVVRMYGMLQRSLAARTHLITMGLHDLVLLAARVDGSVWTAFISDERFAALHSSLCLSNDAQISAAIMNRITGFCIEAAAPADAISSYWTATLAAVPDALAKMHGTTKFFDFANDLLMKNVAMHQDEAGVRTIARQLSQQLWTHEHCETPFLQADDHAVAGTLRLMLGLVTILRSLKKPVALEGLAPEILKRLLFAPDTGYWSLISQNTRGLAYDLLKATCETLPDYLEVVSAVDEALDSLPNNSDVKFPGQESWIRGADQLAGLTNLGMTCYMNSLLQQLFANLTFRQLIFDVPVEDPSKQAVVLELQKLFAGMQEGPNPCMETKPLAAVLGTVCDSQEDVHSFYSSLLSRLEECMPTNELKKALTAPYAGTFTSQVRGDCGHISSRNEAFTEVAITVGNKASLVESLDEFVQGEPMRGANKYKCSACGDADGGQLVDAVKRTCLKDTPDNLTFCLKRFTFEAMQGYEGKINDRFDFPAEIDMSPYQLSRLEGSAQATENDLFDLVGIIVHWGDLQYGHYWSYVRLSNGGQPPVWVRAEDSGTHVCAGGVEEVQAACRGGLLDVKGLERSDNAYVLLYRRRAADQAHAQMFARPNAPNELVRRLPPRVAAPPDLVQANISAWRWRYRINNLFSSQFGVFMDWLVGVHVSGANQQEEGTDKPIAIVKSTMDRLAAASEKYLLHLLISSPACVRRTVCFFTAMHSSSMSASASSAFSNQLLHYMADDQDRLSFLWCADKPQYRRTVIQEIQRLLPELAKVDAQQHCEILDRISRSHASVLPHVHFMCDKWTDYFAFASYLSGISAEQTAALLNHYYLRTSMELLHMESMPIEFKKNQIWQKYRVADLDLTPIFSFVYELMANHVSFDACSSYYGSYHVEDGRVMLKEQDWELLNKSVVYQGSDFWILAHVAKRMCKLPGNKELSDYAPAKLFGLLARHTGYETLYMLRQTILLRLKVDTAELRPLLSMIFHFCRERLDDTAGGLLKQVSKLLIPWVHDFYLEVLEFWQITAEVARSTAIACAPDWTPEVLRRSHPEACKIVFDWFNDHVFTDPCPTAPETCDRLRTARSLAKPLLTDLKKAFDKAVGGSGVLYSYKLVGQAEQYLTALHEEIESSLANDERKQKVNFGNELLIEYEESKSTLTQLRVTLEELGDWKISMPPPPAPPRATITMDSGDEEASSYTDMSEEVQDAPRE